MLERFKHYARKLLALINLHDLFFNKILQNMLFCWDLVARLDCILTESVRIILDYVCFCLFFAYDLCCKMSELAHSDYLLSLWKYKLEKIKLFYFVFSLWKLYRWSCLTKLENFLRLKWAGIIFFCRFTSSLMIILSPVVSQLI